MNVFELTRSLIEIESATGNEQAVGRYLADTLRSLGWQVRLQEVSSGRQNVFAFRDDPWIVFSSHMDTVNPYLEYREDEDYIYGRGACDAKGIIASQTLAAEQLTEEGILGVGLLFVVGEEGGSDGAREAGRMKNDSRFLINGEPTRNRLIRGTKGAMRVILEARGKTAHSAYPEKGDSAILKLLEAIRILNSIALPVDPFFGSCTLNIGRIEGGIQANVVPDYARAEMMFRTVTPVESMITLLNEVLPPSVQSQIPYAENPVLLEQMEGFQSEVVAFATDIPLLQKWGRPFLLGPGSILDAHTAHEKVSKSELVHSISLYKKLVKSLLKMEK
ncbi:hypothetical protein BVY01_03375 [bacterium I07]|nr:hypothetical protein BVY01_03375 [bacterium I07]